MQWLHPELRVPAAGSGSAAARAEPVTEPMDKTQPMDPRTEPMVAPSASSNPSQPHPPGGVSGRRY